VGFDRTGNEALPIAERRQVQGRFLLREGFQSSRILEVGGDGIRARRIPGGKGRGCDREREEQEATTNS